MCLNPGDFKIHHDLGKPTNQQGKRIKIHFLNERTTFILCNQIFCKKQRFRANRASFQKGVN